MDCSKTQVKFILWKLTVKQSHHCTECLLFDLRTNYCRSITIFLLYSRLFTISAFILGVQNNCWVIKPRNKTLQPQFLHRVTADTRSVHGAMKCICKLVWRGLETSYFYVTRPKFCTVDIRGYFLQVTTYREKVASTRRVRHRRPCLKWFSVIRLVLWLQVSLTINNVHKILSREFWKNSLERHNFSKIMPHLFNK